MRDPPRGALAKGAKVPSGPPGAPAFSIGHIVASRREVDALVEQAQRAGAAVTERPHDRFWGGYSADFQDPDGHLWEIAWHPAWEVTQAGPRRC